MLKFSNVVKLSVCAALISASFGCASTAKHESTGQYIDDSVITTKVKTGILEEKSLKVFQIGVKSNQGVVELSGEVDSLQSIDKAGMVASHVNGVTEVKNSLTIK